MKHTIKGNFITNIFVIIQSEIKEEIIKLSKEMNDTPVVDCLKVSCLLSNTAWTFGLACKQRIRQKVSATLNQLLDLRLQKKN